MNKVSLFIGLLVSYLTLHQQPVEAQVVADETLDAGSSIVSGNTDIRIDGGTQRGENLFHSFETFSIPEGYAAFFNNSLDIERILTRVTGTEASTIDGLIRSNGAADLYILNPNGIEFLPNALLAIGGSLFATTGDAVRLRDGSLFSTEGQVNSVLTSSVPVGLGLSSNSTISIANSGHTIRGSLISPNYETAPVAGLSVRPGRGIILIGGHISSNGGVIRAPGGNIYLAAIQEGSVEFDPNLESFSYQADEVGRLTLTDSSFVDLRGETGGSAKLVASEISVLNGATIQSSSLVDSLQQDFIELVSDSLIIDGRMPSSPTTPIGFLPPGVLIDNFGPGMSGAIIVRANDVRLSNAALLYQRSFSSGAPGHIVVRANESVIVEGQSPYTPALTSAILSTNVGPNTSAQGIVPGSISISTTDLHLVDGGSITSATVGSGDSADISIVSDDILIRSSANPIVIPSAIVSTTTLPPAINTPPPISQIDDFSLSGNGGDITVTVNSLRVLEGGQVASRSDSFGNSGNINVTANEKLVVDGIGFDGGSSLISSGAFTATPSIVESFGFETSPTGEAGVVSITTPSLLVSNAGTIGVQNEGTGNAGDLAINAESLRVLSNGRLSAVTSGGQGGSITIDALTLFADDQATISASAAGGGRGGNITVDSEVIALLNESAISANAVEGEGGQVIVVTDALLQSSDSSITATSEAGPELDGNVDIQAPDETLRADIEVTPQIIQIPEISAACINGSEESSEFIVTGRGGLPRSPFSIQQSYSGWRSPEPVAASIDTSRASQIFEAQGWVRDKDGTVTLTVHATNPGNIAQTTACVNDPQALNQS